MEFDQPAIGPYRLRPYQIDMLSQLAEDLKRLACQCRPRRVLFVACTGAGKSVMALAMAQAAIQDGKSVGFITSGRQLIFQFANHLHKAQLDCSVLMNNSDPYQYQANSPIQVISKDTLAKAIDPLQWDAPDILIVDEADKCRTDIWQQFLTRAKTVIGLTATPCQANGDGLDWYEAIICSPNYSTLIHQGYLVDIEPYSPIRPDLSHVPKVGSDYHQGKLSKLMLSAPLVGSLPTSWLSINKQRVPTVAFCVNKTHTVGVCAEYNSAGICADYILDSTPQDKRLELFERLESGNLEILVSCATLQRGFDLPAVSCGVLAKPSRSFRLYRQTTGRLLRPYPGKKKALLIDHSGAVIEMCQRYGLAGWPAGDVQWQLGDSQRPAVQPAPKHKKLPKEPYHCPQCAALWGFGSECPNCGYHVQQRGQRVMTAQGVLRRVKKPKAKRHISDDQRIWLQCLGIAANCKRPMTYATAAHIFRQRTGKWPEDMKVGPIAQYHKRNRLVRLLWPGFVRRRKKQS